MTATDVWMIWATETERNDVLWLVGAWDDATTAENNLGWADAVKQAKSDHGADNIQIIKTTIDLDAVHAAFNADAAHEPAGIREPELDVRMIWAREDNVYWIEDAWDNQAAEEALEDWEKAVSTVVERYGADNTRVVKVEVDYAAVAATFVPPTITSGPVRTAAVTA
ncbi:hypothetical protein [Agromyces humi]|uniref:hypothetical protein n=1 Tax=Agromyces humi TaxID=1766800 RepID=UPI0013594D0C|nr:hypothetical protein [Agromyces humi]